MGRLESKQVETTDEKKSNENFIKERDLLLKNISQSPDIEPKDKKEAIALISQIETDGYLWNQS